MKKLLLTLVIFSLAACGDLEDDSSARELPSDGDQETFAISFLDTIQQRSFDANREFCGFFGVNESGDIEASEPTQGQLDSCLSDEPEASLEIFGSYHSHGAYDPEVDTEVPSLTDLRADIAEKVDGFIGTPGGRVWVNDYEDEVAYLLCENCIRIDPNFIEGDFPEVEESYTLEQLEDRFAE